MERPERLEGPLTQLEALLLQIDNYSASPAVAVGIARGWVHMALDLQRKVDGYTIEKAIGMLAHGYHHGAYKTLLAGRAFVGVGHELADAAMEPGAEEG